MAPTRIIQPLDLADFAVTPETTNPGFADLVNSEVGDAASPLDGFDDVFAELSALVDALDSGLALLAGADGGTLDDTFADILPLDDAPVAQTLADVTAALPDIDAAANDLDELIGTTPETTPPAGGGGAPAPMREMDTATGPLRACTYGLEWPSPQNVQLPHVEEALISITEGNTFDTTVWRFICPKPGQFTCEFDAPATLTGPQSYHLRITQLLPAVAGDQVQLYYPATQQYPEDVECIVVASAGAGSGAGLGARPPHLVPK